MAAPTGALRLYKSPESFEKMQHFYETNLEKLPVPVESQYVETRFGPTHMLVAGPIDGPPLILIQGLAGSAVLWHHQLEDFAAVHRVYALDTVGQPGRSAPNPPSILKDEYALWLLDVLDGLQLQQAAMVGISSAGWGIMRLGRLHPERISKAVLLSPLRLARARLNGRRWVGSAMKPDTEGDQLEDRLTTRDFAPDSNGRRYDQRLARAMALATRHYRLGLALGIDPDAPRLKKFWTGFRVIHLFASPAPRRELQALSVPCLIVIGEHETLYNPERAAKRAALIPQARVEIVPEAGHAAVFDRPAYINPIILDYLAQGAP